jgi:predicted Zn-dependent protease with MMP-like domain
MLCILLGLIAILALFLAQGSFVQGLIRPAYNENKCYDSDGGQVYDVKGTTYGKMSVRNSKTKFTDFCDGNVLTEYYCEGNKVKKETKEGKGCAKCEDGTCQNPNPYGNCIPVILNGQVENNYNFIFAFYDFSEEELNQKAYDYTRAQFFRSEYDVPNKTDGNFGFSSVFPNAFLTRLGLFEIEPFKSNQKYFNVFYINHSFGKNNNPNGATLNECPFLANSKYNNLITLKHKASEYPNYNTWELEEIGNAFNHEIGHSFGLYDEYFTEMNENDLTQEEVEAWNNKIPNCDYNKPYVEADYESGNGYCEKWCNGVDADAYQEYKTQRDLYDVCNTNLHEKSELQSWISFCSEQLNFSEYFDSKGNFPTFVVAGTPGWTDTQEKACQSIFQDSPDNDFFESNIQYFCYAGTLFDIWDLDIGNSCQNGSGCYAGCGGFSKDIYPSGDIGAFGDAFRPTSHSIMQGGPFWESSGSGFINKIHQFDNELPSYGKYDEEIILNYMKEIGVLP